MGKKKALVLCVLLIFLIVSILAAVIPPFLDNGNPNNPINVSDWKIQTVCSKQIGPTDQMVCSPFTTGNESITVYGDRYTTSYLYLPGTVPKKEYIIVESGSYNKILQQRYHLYSCYDLSSDSIYHFSFTLGKSLPVYLFSNSGYNRFRNSHDVSYAIYSFFTDHGNFEWNSSVTQENRFCLVVDNGYSGASGGVSVNFNSSHLRFLYKVSQETAESYCSDINCTFKNKAVNSTIIIYQNELGYKTTITVGEKVKTYYIQYRGLSVTALLHVILGSIAGFIILVGMVVLCICFGGSSYSPSPSPPVLVSSIKMTVIAIVEG